MEKVDKVKFYEKAVYSEVLKEVKDKRKLIEVTEKMTIKCLGNAFSHDGFNLNLFEGKLLEKPGEIVRRGNIWTMKENYDDEIGILHESFTHIL